MSESQCCPVCDRAAIPPRWPSVRTTPWTDDCACSDHSHCLMHRYGDEQPPKRPSQEVMTARAQAEFERACERHVEMLVQFMDYEELKKERDEARAALRTVAERQREACADVVRELLDEGECDCPPEWPRCGLHRAALRLRATPLVTEGDK